MLTTACASWDEILATGPAPDPWPAYQSGSLTDRELLLRAQSNDWRLNPWEAGFLRDISQRIYRGCTLSAKQRAKLEQIAFNERRMTERVAFPSSLAFLDAQHEELDSKVRDLGTLHNGADGESVMFQVRHILKLLRDHTIQEEHAMETLGYSELALHKKYHENVLASVETMFEFFTPASMLEYREAIASYLQNRLSEEMLVDRLFAKFLKEQGIKCG